MILKTNFTISVLTILLCGAGVTSLSAQPQSDKNAKIEQQAACAPLKQTGTDKFAEETAAAAKSFLADLKASEKFRNHKIRILRTILDNQTGVDASQNRNAKDSFMVFDYTINKALFITVHRLSKEIISEERLPGRPQPSDEEIEEAKNLIKATPTLAGFLQRNTQIIGGFIIDGPRGLPPEHRYMQMRIVTADMKQTKKVVVVDLSEGKIVSK